MSVSESIEEFRSETVDRGLKESSLDKYERWIRRFELWRADSVTEKSALKFDSMLVDEDRPEYPWTNTRGPSAPDSYAYRARQVAASALIRWFPWHYSVDLDKEPKEICKGEPEPFDPHIVPTSECRHTINSGRDCNVTGCKAALQLSYDAILRAAELTRARVEDVDFGGGAVRVRAVKGSEWRTVGVDAKTERLLRHHVDRIGDREYLFHNTYDRPWTPNAWTNHVRRHHHEGGSHVLFRHSPICHRLESGEDIGDVYRRARHKFLTTTMKYAKVVDVDVDTASLPTSVDN